jgi:hypothetical protein
MKDDDFVRVVGDKGKEKGGETKTKQICDWRKTIRIVFDQSMILPNFWMFYPKIFLFFRFSSFSLAETTPLHALAEVRLRLSF